MNAAPDYITRADLDLQKWDACIRESQNGLIYGYSFYLDKMARHWDALIWNDYSAVMPLTWNRKAGIYYLYQPAFAPNLGVFGKQVNRETVSRFVESIPGKFQLVEISLNAANDFNDMANDDMQWMKRRNYVLSLSTPYSQLYNGYNDNIKRNIKKCLSLGCRYATNVPIEHIIELAKNQLNRLTHLKQQDFLQFKLLFDELAEKKQAITYGVYMNDNLISSAAFFFSNGRAYYILVGNHPNGKTVGASHYLIDRFIADHAEQSLLLDFEGSDINSLAFFYSSFGAGLEYYPSLKKNHLPWYIKWLK